jgi:hypothetical protein
MGYGPVINGKQMPITPYKGSWAWDMEQRRLDPNPPPLTHGLQWPLGCTVRDALPKAGA